MHTFEKCDRRAKFPSCRKLPQICRSCTVYSYQVNIKT